MMKGPDHHSREARWRGREGEEGEGRGGKWREGREVEGWEEGKGGKHA